MAMEEERRPTREEVLAEADREADEILLRTGPWTLLVGLATYVAYYGADRLIVPSSAIGSVTLERTFASAVMASCVGGLFVTKRGLVARALLTIAFLVAAFAIIAMTTAWDVGANGYAGGLIVASVCVGFLPFPPLLAGSMLLSVVLGYALANLFVGVPKENGPAFLVHNVFLAGTALMVFVQCLLTRRLRLTSCEQRLVIASEKRTIARLAEGLELQVAERTATLASTNAAIQRFVPREFLHALGHDDVTTTKLGDATAKSITVLFADIRNFTASSEGMSPEETFAFLNGCLSKLGPHVRAQSGFVDKYIGDAIMALFRRS